MQFSIPTLLSLVSMVAAHGHVLSPTPRAPGSAFKAACGEQMFNQQTSDINGNIEGMKQVAGSSFDPSTCQLELCKGFKFEDNSANIQSFTAGQTIDFSVQIAAPHTGTANVSVVDTASNSIIGSPLISFTNYASTKTGVAANNTAFSVTMPSDLPSTCSTAGNCVLQWFWFSDEANQTYISCVDFSLGGSGSDSSSGSSSSSSSSAAGATSTSAAATSAAATSAAATTTSASSTTLKTSTTSRASASTTTSAVQKAVTTSASSSSTTAASTTGSASATGKTSCRRRVRRSERFARE